jgi:pyruvate/2-oxoglutarate dehydrogenase complex dihydrolipoamide acyltransferase (E2) component
MAREFRLPDIGEGLTEAEIVRWLVPVGNRVKTDQPVVEVETDKAVVEIPSPYPGVVLHHGADEGQTLAVGEILLVIGEEGESWTAGKGEGIDKAPGPANDEKKLEEIEDQVATDEGMPEADSPGSQAKHGSLGNHRSSGNPSTAKPIIGNLAEEAEELPSRQGRVARALGRTQALPLVRKLAKDLGVDLDQIVGTGPEGRIAREDVLAAAEAKAGHPVQEPPPPTLPPKPVSRKGERRPLSKLRRTIADNMSKSWSEIPHVTTFDQSDASRLLAARKALENRHQTKIPLEALIIKAVVPALQTFPEFNASIDGDDLIVYRHFDIGVAVDTPDGLLVAVVKAADQRTLLELAADVRRLAESAKARRLAPAELAGQTFTISNIGALGGGFGTPIVPPGTTAILSVGRAVDQPVAGGGTVYVAPLMPLSLSYDHRAIDGGLGRRFMAMVLENLAEPTLSLA